MSDLKARWRDLTDPVQSKAREHPLRNGAVLLALLGLAVYMAVAHDIPLINGKPGSELRAEFTSVNQVSGQTPVRVNGVDVGIVDEIGPGPDPRRSSVVSMRITDDDVVVREDATASIRWRTVLGGRMFIDLDPGSPRARELGEDEVIPVSATTNQTELDDVLQVYDGGTEQAQRDVFRGAGEGFSDPESTRGAIDALDGLGPVGRGLEPYLGTEVGDLRKLVAATAATVEALGSSPAGLERLVGGARRTLRATATRREDLGRFLDESPPSLDATLRTSERVRETLDHLDPLVASLRPGVRRIAPATAVARPALDETGALLREARPLLRDLKPTFTDLVAVGDAGVPIVRGLRPVVQRVNEVILPFLDRTDPDTQVKNFTSIGATFAVLAMGAAEFDNIGHRLHLATPTSNNSVITAYTAQNRRSCLSVARTRAQRKVCPALARGLAQGQFGRPRRSR